VGVGRAKTGGGGVPDTRFCMGVQARGRKRAYRNPFKNGRFLPCQSSRGGSRGVGVILGVWVAASGGFRGFGGGLGVLHPKTR